jgi:hypothetical protein
MTAKLSVRFEFERVLWRQNVTRVAGVDEAGHDTAQIRICFSAAGKLWSKA